MELVSQTDAIKTNIDNGDSERFTVEVNNVMFRDFFDTRYSDKPGAIIRELVCNAWDSHIAAGTTDKLIDITLPNSISSDLIIRDYGLGLSNDDMMNLYRTFFKSRSRFSSEATGGLGIGSKSPFCYCDNFLAESFFNGIHYKYQVFLDEDIPTILPIGEEATNEPNGLKITIAVKEEDFDMFNKAADKQLFLFKGKTTYEGDCYQLSAFHESNLFLKSDKFWVSNIVDGNSRYGNYNNNCLSTELYAAMGNVLYKIDASLVQDSDDLSRGIKAIMFFELCEIDFASSREALSYKDRTIIAIKAHLSAMVEAISEKFEKDKEDIISLSPYYKLKKCLELQALYSSNTLASRIYKINSYYNQKSLKVPYWTEEIENIYREVNNFHLCPMRYRAKRTHRWGSEDRVQWVSSSLTISDFVKSIVENSCDVIISTKTNIIIGKDYRRIMDLSELNVRDRNIVYGSKENLDNFANYFSLELNFIDIADTSNRRKRTASEHSSRKEYITWIKGTRDEIRLSKINFRTILQNNEDNEPKEWMRILSYLIDTSSIPFVYYRGSCRSKLENSFKVIGHYNNAKIDDSILQSIKDNIVKMRLLESLYCKRYLSEEIANILEKLPNSQFAKEIMALPLYNYIGNPDNIYSRLTAVGLVASNLSTYSHTKNIPSFLNNYPMLRNIRAVTSLNKHSLDEVTRALDQAALIDYIRLCEGEKHEVRHYNIIRNSTRRIRRELKLVQSRTRREESTESDNRE